MVKQKLKDHAKESALFHRRLIVSLLTVLGLVVLLIFRLSYLQVIEHTVFTTLSKKNQVTLLPIAPNRGLIYDRSGVLVGQNTPIFSLEIIPDKVKNLNKTIEKLATIIQLNDTDKLAFYKQLKQHRRFDSIPLKIKLDNDELARFYLNQYRFPGVFVQARLMRYYPLGSTLENVVGYVGRINEQELGKVSQTNYAATNFIGKLGIEAYYENKLHGKVGYQEVETDASGRIVRVLKRLPPTPGNDLYLSVDTKLQIAAEKALGDEFGAVVAINPQNGEILAMVSQPSYDPNLFVRGMSQTEYKALQNAAGRPLYNRTIRGLYPFGSTIKPFIALEALNAHYIDDKFKIRDPGYFSLPGAGHVYRDWKKGGHGTVDVIKAITVSCDTFFYTIGMKMGISHLSAILHDFGFGKTTGVDLNEELPGLVPTPAWKMKTKQRAWYPGDTVVASIGQGYLLTTPLQLANGVAQIAMRGKGYQPHLLRGWNDKNGKYHPYTAIPLPIIQVDPIYWDTVIQGMRNVMVPGGTAAAFGKTPYTVAGKTGTAQVYSTQGKTIVKNLPKELRDHTLFIAFAPVEKPQIAIAVIVEHTKTAKFIARKVFDAYFDVEKVSPENDKQTTG